MKSQQLTLPIYHLEDSRLDNFYPNNNLLLLSSLAKNLNNPQQQFFYLWGEMGSGKSHLLKAAVNQFLNTQRSAIYISFKQFEDFSPALLENLEQQELVCLDDLQAITGDRQWELAIFNLFNSIKENGRTLLLLSANKPANNLSIQLPDLVSRLKWGETYHLVPLNDEQKIKVLQQNAYQRGIELTDETANFLLKRLDRNMTNLLEVLKKLDQASLQAQRKLTIPFVKETLHI